METKELVQDLYSNDNNNVTLKLFQCLRLYLKNKFGKTNTTLRTIRETRRRQFRSEMKSYRMKEIKEEKAEDDPNEIETKKKNPTRRSSKK